MSKSKKWVRPAAYLGMGALFLVMAIGLVRGGNWWAVPFLMIASGLFMFLLEISLLIYRILTTNFSLAIGRDSEYAWVFHFSLGKIIYTILLLLLRRWRGLANIRIVDAAWSGVKAGASVQAPEGRLKSIAGRGRITEASDEKPAVQRSLW
ncbi:MAG: hypothetical protein AB1384_14375 [Actinomycetota bacterium]